MNEFTISFLFVWRKNKREREWLETGIYLRVFTTTLGFK